MMLGRGCELGDDILEKRCKHAKGIVKEVAEKIVVGAVIRPTIMLLRAGGFLWQAMTNNEKA